MGGHSHWSQIKRQKWANDAKRGQLFSKLVREIAVAAREGGPDPDLNPRLRLAIERAREQNMPLDTIERAIKRATGADAEAAQFQEVRFEGYGPGGVAIMVDALTDNRNRTVSEVRQVLSRNGGSLGEAGCVSWQFEGRGLIVLETQEGQDADELALLAIDAGAEDVKVEDGRIEVYTDPADLAQVRAALEEQGLQVASAELTMMPKASVPLDEKTAVQVLKLLDALEELEDVQRVYSNAEFPDSVLLEYANR
jgi:YebC/PmpR family DNA-binding regulatory protein